VLGIELIYICVWCRNCLCDVEWS